MLAFLVVAVLAYAPPSGNAGAQLVPVSQALKRALRQGGVTVIDGALERARAELARGWVDESELAFFKGARELVHEGRRALERVELVRAEALLAEAERLAAAELARPGAAELVSEAALFRGVALVELGRDAEGKRSFQRAAALDPGAQLTESSVRPDVARAFAQAVSAKGSRVELRVTASAPEARIEIDGRATGAAPALAKVTPGEHLVVARAPGRRAHAALVEVGEAGLATEVALAPEPSAEALERLRARPDAAGASILAKLVGLDGVYAVAAGVDQGRLTLVGQRLSEAGCATPVETAAAERGLNAAEPALALVTRLSAEKLACPPAVAPSDGREVVEAAPILTPRPPPERPKPRTRFYQRPWLWLGLLAVASIAVGAAVALVPSHPTFSASADTCKFGAVCR